MPRPDLGVGHRESIDETAALRPDVEGRDGALRPSSRCRKTPLPGRSGRATGGVDDRVEIAGAEAGGLERPLRGREGEVGTASRPRRTQRRSWIPVRSRIHSSDVSIRLASSSLVTTGRGPQKPVPRMAERRTKPPDGRKKLVRMLGAESGGRKHAPAGG